MLKLYDYLPSGNGYKFLPEAPWERAKIMEWLFFAQYSHEPSIATSRFWASILGKAAEYREALLQKRELGYQALTVMEKQLLDRFFGVGDRYSIADIALFAYAHVAPEGGFFRDGFPAIRHWLGRIASRSRYLPLTQA